MENPTTINKDLEVEIIPEDYPTYDSSFKIIVIGNQGVGKSCLSIQATKNIFQNNYLATVGFEFFSFNCKIKEKIIKLQIWDTCGQEVYRSLITNFYKNASLAVIVYAINDQKSFNDVERWVKDLRENSSPDVKIFLIGNKCDLEDEREVTKEKALNLKNNYEFDAFYETSAKTGFNAKEMFIEAAKILFEDYNKYEYNNNLNNNNVNKGEKLKISNQEENKKKPCCGNN